MEGVMRNAVLQGGWWGIRKEMRREDGGCSRCGVRNDLGGMMWRWGGSGRRGRVGRVRAVVRKKTKEQRAAEKAALPPGPKAGLETDPEGTRTPFTSVTMGDESELPMGSEAVPLDSEVFVYQEQKGFFPKLEHSIPKQDHLSVIVTRDYHTADKWVAGLEVGGEISSVGYAAYLKDPLTKPYKIALISDAEELPEFVDLEAADISDEDPTVDEEGLSDFELDLYGKVVDDSDDGDDDIDELPFVHQRSGENKDEPVVVEYPRLRNGGASERFDYYQDDVLDEDAEKENKEIRAELSKYPFQTLPPELILPESPPRAWTKDPKLVQFWNEDQDGPDTERLPDLAVPLKLNRIPILSLAVRDKVLILQIRRMRGIPPRVYDLLCDPKVVKHSFGHKSELDFLRKMGIAINGGQTTEELLLGAMESKKHTTTTELLSKLPVHRKARTLVGVGISDREFYERDYNNPLLSERHLSCLAKEAFAASAVLEVLTKAKRPDFFNIEVFCMNPIPPSYMEQLPGLPKTAVHYFKWTRGAFYKDMGGLLPRVEFDVDVTVTRDPEVVEEWCKERRLEEMCNYGYNMEWVPGMQDEASAIVTISTEKKILICQLLYMEQLPPEAFDIIYQGYNRKTGPNVLLRSLKQLQPLQQPKGGLHLFRFFLRIFRRAKIDNLPKVVRDMTYDVICDLLLAVESAPKTLPDGIRWDKPVFNVEEVEYQAFRAWSGWALQWILEWSTLQHGERLKAYLLGPLYVPKKHKIPVEIRERLQKIVAKETGDKVEEQPKVRKSPPTKGLMYQQEVDERALDIPDVFVPEKLQEAAQAVGPVSSEELTDLIQSFFT